MKFRLLLCYRIIWEGSFDLFIVELYKELNLTYTGVEIAELLNQEKSI